MCTCIDSSIACLQPPPPPQIGGRIQPISPICSAHLLGFCDCAASFCRLVGASGILGHLIGGVTLRCVSFSLGHWIIPFLSILVVQIGTTKCFSCPQKDASVVPWDSLSPDDQIFLRDTYPDGGQGAVCDLCVRSARPSALFSRGSSSTSSSALQSVDSGLQLPSAPLVPSGAATSLGTESVESGVVEPSASVAESSTAATGSATGSDGQKVRAKPLCPDTLKRAKQPRVLKKLQLQNAKNSVPEMNPR